jgi:HD-GYP domain-containing protein (c-di-GMP phosphodiesterase class II)
LVRCAGTQFDSQVVEAFLSTLQDGPETARELEAVA